MKKNLSYLATALVAAGIIGCADEGQNVSNVQSNENDVDVTSLSTEGTVSVSKALLPELLLAARKDGLSLRLMSLDGDKATVRFDRNEITASPIVIEQPLEAVLSRYTCTDPDAMTQLRTSLARYTCTDPDAQAMVTSRVNASITQASLESLVAAYTCTAPD